MSQKSEPLGLIGLPIENQVERYGFLSQPSQKTQKLDILGANLGLRTKGSKAP